MTTTDRVWIHRGRTRLRQCRPAFTSRHRRPRRLHGLRRRPRRENVARRARIRQIHDLLLNAVAGEDPPDDGIAEPGMVLTVRYDDTGEMETFLLGVRGAEHAGIKVYSVHSPLGRAIAGARPGEQRTYSVPSGPICP